MYAITNDGKVPYDSSYTLNISLCKWCSLAPNELVTRLVDWVMTLE